MSGSAYHSELRLSFDAATPGSRGLRPELADVGRLVRRGVQAVVGAARAADQPRLSQLVAGHLRVDPAGLEIVEETWAGYDHVNVQAGLDVWLGAVGRSAQLIGIAGFQHTMFGLAAPDRRGLLGHARCSRRCSSSRTST